MNLRGALPALDAVRPRGERPGAPVEAPVPFEVPEPPAGGASSPAPHPGNARSESTAARRPPAPTHEPAPSEPAPASDEVAPRHAPPAAAAGRGVTDRAGRHGDDADGRAPGSLADATPAPRIAHDAPSPPSQDEAADRSATECATSAAAPGVPERLLALLQRVPTMAASPTGAARASGHASDAPTPPACALAARGPATLRAPGTAAATAHLPAASPGAAMAAAPGTASLDPMPLTRDAHPAAPPEAVAAWDLRDPAIAHGRIPGTAGAIVAAATGVMASVAHASAAAAPPWSEVTPTPRAPSAALSVTWAATPPADAGIVAANPVLAAIARPTGAGPAAPAATAATAAPPAVTETAFGVPASAVPDGTPRPSPGGERDAFAALADMPTSPSEAPTFVAQRAAADPAGAARIHFTAPLAVPAHPGAGLDDAFDQRIVWMAEQRIGQAEMRVSPDGLGPIDVRLQVDGQRVTAQFNAASADVRQALEAGMDRLRELLGARGMELADAHVGQRRSNGDGARAEPGPAPDGEAPADDGAVVTTVRRLRARGLVDTYA